MWNNDIEISFFTEAIRNGSTATQLFYNLESGHFAYVPKRCDAEGQTLQSRNSLIGSFTENWCRDLFSPIARHFNLYAVNGVICDELSLTRQSSADLAFCTTDSNIQVANNIKIIFEIKMSVVSNYRFTAPNTITYVGDYKSHKGNPSLLRSDSMLKAIGKAINIRVSGLASTKIPIIVLGNSPITDSYTHKVDFLKQSGVTQGFWSLNPAPTATTFINESNHLGFLTIPDEISLREKIGNILATEMNYFSSMISKEELGRFIETSNAELTNITKAERFLSLIRN